MSFLSQLFGRLQPSPAKGTHLSTASSDEVDHWNEIERRGRAGERLFWLNHPRIAHHYYRKGLIDGLPWREWVVREWGGPAEIALELGCGNGAALAETIRSGVARNGVGQDLDESRFHPGDAAKGQSLLFLAGDVNETKLEKNTYDLIYALQSFHHFDAYDHIMEQVNGALTDRGYFILDEFVGPPRFQWTDLQLSITGQLLGLMPRHLRMYAHGIEKRAEGRSTPEQVMAVCPSEAIRCDEMIDAFHRHFDTLHCKKLGGTIQHLLYSGIVHNFRDNDEQIDHLIDCVDGIETTLIEQGTLTSDFVLLVGRKQNR